MATSMERPHNSLRPGRIFAGIAPCCISVLVLVLLAPGCQKKTEPAVSPPPEINLDVPPPRPTITQKTFEKLLYDMPYADVVEFLGMDPTRQESTYSEGVDGYTAPSVISWYIWENNDGSYVRLGFTKKLLTDITSNDLPTGDESSSP